MEKHQEQAQKSRIIWDCDSSLYDSFELKSLKRQLDAAIVSRTLSMPHLSEHAPLPVRALKKQTKVARSLYKLLRSVFRRRTPFQSNCHVEYGFRGASNNLATIPEVSEKGFDSPEFGSAVRKTMSERFAGTAGELLKSNCHVEYGFRGASNNPATIPEVSEKAFDSPELGSAVRKTMSERFAGTVGELLRAPAL